MDPNLIPTAVMFLGIGYPFAEYLSYTGTKHLLETGQCKYEELPGIRKIFPVTRLKLYLERRKQNKDQS